MFTLEAQMKSSKFLQQTLT